MDTPNRLCAHVQMHALLHPPKISFYNFLSRKLKAINIRRKGAISNPFYKKDSIVAIDFRTQEHLNNILQKQTENIEYMRESKENFFHVLEQIDE